MPYKPVVEGSIPSGGLIIPPTIAQLVERRRNPREDEEPL
tara:strand:+ start:30 stop:149 length:120 start_codon:yes stop_codon:yes gene_type:complete